MERRELLAGGSSVVAVALAGCAFDDETEGSGPADNTSNTDDDNDAEDGTEETGGDTESDDETDSAGNESNDSAGDEGSTDDTSDIDGDDNETDGNETDDGANGTDGSETDGGGNETDGDETDDSETDGNETDGNETDGEDEESFGGDDTENLVLTIRLEGEDGEPVSEGVVVTIAGEPNGVPTAHNYQHDIEDGEIQQTVNEGTWTVTVEPADGESFEPQEEEVELEDDEEVTIELDGASDGESGDEVDAGDGTDDGENGDGTDGEGDEDGDTDEGDTADEGDTDDESGENTGESDEEDNESGDGDDEDADTRSGTDGDDADEGTTEGDDGDDGAGADSEDGTETSESTSGEIPGLESEALVADGEVLADIEAERRGSELLVTVVPTDTSGDFAIEEVGAALAATADAVSDPDALRSATDQVTVVVQSPDGEELFSGSGGMQWLLAFGDGGGTVEGVTGLLG